MALAGGGGGLSKENQGAAKGGYISVDMPLLGLESYLSFFSELATAKKIPTGLLSLLMFPNLITTAEPPPFLDIGTGGVQLFRATGCLPE